MSNGRYSDDSREDSLFKDDEMRWMKDLGKESIRENSKVPAGAVILVVVIAGLFLWWLFWG